MSSILNNTAIHIIPRTVFIRLYLNVTC